MKNWKVEKMLFMIGIPLIVGGISAVLSIKGVQAYEASLRSPSCIQL